jgi:hypothetical protein
MQMNFKDAKRVRDIIWFEGPILTEIEHRGKSYLIKWVDIDDERTYHTWMIFDVTQENLGLYFGKALTMRDLEERAVNHFMFEGFIDDAEATWIDYENAPDDWKARSNSYYDESIAA